MPRAVLYAVARGYLTTARRLKYESLYIKFVFNKLVIILLFVGDSDSNYEIF